MGANNTVLNIAFDADTPVELVKALEPDVLVKGADYLPEAIAGADLVQAAGGRVHLVPLRPGCSSTRLIEAAQG